MWCTTCQQDVPGLASSVDGTLCCPRCGREVAGSGVPNGCDGSPRRGCRRSIESEQAAPSLLPDPWELELQLQHVERVLGIGKRHTDRRAKAAYRRAAARYDVGHAVVPPWHIELKREIAPAEPKAAAPTYRRRGTFGVLVWVAFALGTTALACGSVLMGWSFLTGRVDLWNIGLPVALGGQIGLLVGLVMRLERLGQDNRSAADKLHSVDAQLHDLRAATQRVGGGQPSHADDAHAETIVGDLKRQLDLLAQRISRP